MDQIVDTPYSIDGAAGNEDPYPLANPDAVPSVTSGTTTTIGVEAQIPVEILMITGGAVVILIVGILFVKRKA